MPVLLKVSTYIILPSVKILDSNFCYVGITSIKSIKFNLKM